MKLASDLPQKFMHACQTGDSRTAFDLFIMNEMFDWTNIRHTHSGDTPLHIAAREGHLHVVESLCGPLAAPVSKVPEGFKELTNNDTKTPLHEAAQYGRFHVVEVLLQKGANVNAVKRGDWTPLMLACTKTGYEAQRCVLRLLSWGADASFPNKDGWTAMHIVCRSGDMPVFNALLRYAPNLVLNRGNNGRTTMQIAAFHGHTELVKVLAGLHKVLVNAVDSTGSSPIHEAMKQGKLEVVKELIQLGARVDAVDASGQNILHIACLIGHADAVEYILSKRLISRRVKDKYSRTPEDVLFENGDSIEVGLHFLNYFSDEDCMC